VEPEETSIARQRLGKQVPAATIEVLLNYNDENGVSCGSTPKLYNEDPRPAGLELKRN
jgi:hypothetical protein